MFETLVKRHLARLGIALATAGGKARFDFNTGESFEIEIRSPRMWRDWVTGGSAALGESFVEDRKSVV